VRVSVQRRRVRLREPLRTAHGTIGERELLTVGLLDAGGLVGYGEAAPLEPYDGVAPARVQRALASYERVLAGASEASDAALLQACRAADELPAALAAIDLALWDRAGRRAGKPVAALLAGLEPDDALARRVAVNATISAPDRRGVAEHAAAAARAGYPCVKLKVGAGDDAARVAAARAGAGPRVALRLDANGAWNVPEAVRWIETLSPAGLELVEEPTHGLRAMREVREQVAVRVSIDETAGEPGALDAGAADAVCLKISRCGGITRLLAAAALVRASGADVYLASTLDGPLGVAAAAHAAVALASTGPLAPCGLATLGMLAGVHDVLPVRGGTIALPAAPGLGVDPL
jgi:L-alanine-DL-glutamate epimerase-like enolase superfamily enzyme